MSRGKRGIKNLMKAAVVSVVALAVFRSIIIQKILI